MCNRIGDTPSKNFTTEINELVHVNKKRKIKINEVEKFSSYIEKSIQITQKRDGK